MTTLKLGNKMRTIRLREERTDTELTERWLAEAIDRRDWQLVARLAESLADAEAAR